VRSIDSQHQSAPESLYAVATCYQFLAEDAEQANDMTAQEDWHSKLYEANQILADNYPSSAYTADALINLGNKYFNGGSSQEIDKEERIRLYQRAIEKYQQAIDSPGISVASKNTARSYLKDTSVSLAADVYIQVTGNLDRAKAADKDLQKAAIESVIVEYQGIVKEFPDTKYADLSLVQIGEGYMVLAEREDKYYNDALDFFDRLWGKYAIEPPVDTQVNRALTYSQSQVATITSYMEANDVHRRTTRGTE